MNYLWKVTSIRVTGEIAKGMEVEVVKNGTTAKPTIKELDEAFHLKYGVALINGCSLSNFEIKQIKL